MSCVKATGVTIGEVERITGIPKRKIKYFIEQKIMSPTQKSESGYWLYSEEDIKKLQLISLYRELEYPDKKIRQLISNPAFEWRKELDRQINALMAKKDRTENRLFMAEAIRYRERISQGMRLFDITAADKMDKEDIKQALCGEFYRLLVTIWEEEESPLGALIKMTEEAPDSPAVQVQTERLCEVFRRLSSLMPDEVLFGFRLISIFSGLEAVFDLLLERNGGVHFVTEAVQNHCDKLENKNMTEDLNS